MDYSTVENIKTWLQETQIYVEENIIKLPRKSSIRLLIIVGAYCLFRPFLLKWGGVKQTSDYDKALEEDGAEDDSAAKESQDVSDVSTKTPGADNDKAGATWGEKARQRQKRPIRELVEGNEEPSGVDADSDKEIEEFLRKSLG